MIRVIVVDDDPFVGVSLETILNAQEDMEVKALGTSGPEAVALFEEHAPDVLLMDIQMPGRAWFRLSCKHASALARIRSARILRVFNSSIIMN